MVRRIGLVSMLAFMGLALTAGVPSATAAVNLGQTGDPTATCSPDAYSAQTEVGGAPGYNVPPGYGVITSWSFQGSSTPGTGELLVWRPTGAPDQFILTHLSPTEPFSAGVVQTFPVRIPVEPNDVLGMHATQPCLLAFGLPGDLVQYVSSATQPAEGSVHTFFQAVNDERLLASAQVEPDADRDGFGDETQDKCVGTAGTANGCPSVVTIDKLKQKGDTKVKVTATVPGAGTLKVGSASDPALASAAAKKNLKAVTRNLTATTKQQVKLTLKLTKSAITKLKTSGKLKLKVKAIYTPVGGPPGAQTKKKKLKT